MAKKKILVVEDEEDLLVLICRRLEQAGYEVRGASDGQAGLSAALDVRPDVIVTDVIMPNKDGNQMIQELRASPEGRQIPVIVLTARTAMRDYFEAVNVDAFLEKPFEIHDLVGKIEEVSTASSRSQSGRGRPAAAPNSVHDEEIVRDHMLNVTPEKQGLSADGPEDGEKAPEALSRRPSKIVRKSMAVLEEDTAFHEGITLLFDRMGVDVHIFRTPEACLEGLTREVPPLLVVRQSPTKTYDALVLAENFKSRSGLRGLPVIIYGSLGRPSSAVDSQGRKIGLVLNEEGRMLIKKAGEILGIA